MWKPASFSSCFLSWRIHRCGPGSQLTFSFPPPLARFQGGDKGPDGGTGHPGESAQIPGAGGGRGALCALFPSLQPARALLSHLLSPRSIQGLFSYKVSVLCLGLRGERPSVGSLLQLIIVLRVSSILGAERQRGLRDVLGGFRAGAASACSRDSEPPAEKEVSTCRFLVKK